MTERAEEESELEVLAMTLDASIYVRLLSALTQVDAKRLAREQKRYGSSNPYALALEIQAAHNCGVAVKAGMSWSRAFADHFTPTRANHGIAKRLGFALDVVRGHWVHRADTDVTPEVIPVAQDQAHVDGTRRN